MLAILRSELKNYYAAHAYRHFGKKSFNPFLEEMNSIADTHPEAPALELKTLQYEFIAEHFTPVVFLNTPFFSEMGVRISEYSGVASGAGAWLMLRNARLWQENAPEMYERHQQLAAAGFHITYGPFVDPDHHCFPFTAVLRHGLGYFYRKYSKNDDLFSQMVCRSLLAVRKIAEKFALKAEQLIPETEEQRLNLQRISAAARRVPWEAPANFYEGLCTLWFCHEVCASIDGIGMAVLGRPDCQLIELYRQDIADGTLSPQEAYDLICRFMVHTDCKLSLERPVDRQFNRGEQGDTLILGGCDENGKDCCNELTRLFLKSHRELKLIYPKLHFRYSSATSPEFMREACRDFMNGRNTVSFLNDDLLIPALIKAGKQPEDARNYVAGGCWEIIAEGCEHSQGANCYFNLARVMDISVNRDPEIEKIIGIKLENPDDAGNFEQLYQIFMANATAMILDLCDRIRIGSRVWSRVNPSPFFSAALKDCPDNLRDYSDGGARYNPHGMPLANLAVAADSLSALREVCFEKKICSLSEYLKAVRSNWEGFELLRQAALAAPRFGDSDSCTALAVRMLQDITAQLKRYNDEHKEIRFQPGIYSYRDIIDWSELTGATPDGRRRGDFLAQGLTPQRYSRHLDTAGILRMVRALPLDEFPANSTLTLTLQKRGMTADKLASVVKCFAGGMLQLNCLDKAELLDAVEHPEKHSDLVVRLYGYSARFVTLDSQMQQEFISRSIL